MGYHISIWKKTLTETVRREPVLQRAGDSASPAPSGPDGRSLYQSQAERIFSVGSVGFPPLPGAHMMVCRENRWYSEVTAFVLFCRMKAFLFASRLLQDEFKGGNTMYNKVSTNLNFVEREKQNYYSVGLACRSVHS